MSKPKKAVRKKPDQRKQLEDTIVRYLKNEANTTLRGRFFDVSSDKGKAEYAEWLANEIIQLNAFAEES